MPDRGRPGRERDDLDDLIDDLVPEVDEPPGGTDLLLLLTGVGLLAWASLGAPPGLVAVAGVAALGLGAILPVRSGWRWVRRRRDDRGRTALLGGGVPLVVSSPSVAALVGSFEELVELAGRATPAVATPALAAGHGAVAEVASLLAGGRAPSSDREVAYVEARGVAVAELVAALRSLARTSEQAEMPDPADDGPAISPEAVLRAREELDEIAASSSVARLDELTAELRDQGHGRR